MPNDQGRMPKANAQMQQPVMSPNEQARLRATQYMATMGPQQPMPMPQPRPQPLPPQMVMIPLPPLQQQSVQPMIAQNQMRAAQAAPPTYFVPTREQMLAAQQNQLFQPMQNQQAPSQGGQQIAQSLRSPITYDPNQEPLPSLYGMETGGMTRKPAAYYKFGRYVDAETGEDVDPASTEYRFYNRAGTESYERPFLPTLKGKYAQNNSTQNLAANNPK